MADTAKISLEDIVSQAQATSSGIAQGREQANIELSQLLEIQKEKVAIEEGRAPNVQQLAEFKQTQELNTQNAILQVAQTLGGDVQDSNSERLTQLAAQKRRASNALLDAQADVINAQESGLSDGVFKFIQDKLTLGAKEERVKNIMQMDTFIQGEINNINKTVDDVSRSQNSLKRLTSEAVMQANINEAVAAQNKNILEARGTMHAQAVANIEKVLNLSSQELEANMKGFNAEIQAAHLRIAEERLNLERQQKVDKDALGKHIVDRINVTRRNRNEPELDPETSKQIHLFMRTGTPIGDEFMADYQAGEASVRAGRPMLAANAANFLQLQASGRAVQLPDSQKPNEQLVAKAAYMVQQAQNPGGAYKNVPGIIYDPKEKGSYSRALQSTVQYLIKEDAKAISPTSILAIPDVVSVTSSATALDNDPLTKQLRTVSKTGIVLNDQRVAEIASDMVRNGDISVSDAAQQMAKMYAVGVAVKDYALNTKGLVGVEYPKTYKTPVNLNPTGTFAKYNVYDRTSPQDNTRLLMEMIGRKTSNEATTQYLLTNPQERY